MPVEDRREQRRLPGAVRPDEPDLLAALDDERRVVEQPLVSRGERDVLGLEHDPPAARRVEEVEPERAALLRQRLDLVSRRRALLLEPGDLRELRLRLLRLVLLVPEPLDEALEAGDVHGDAVGDLAGRLRPRRLLPPPLVPGPGEVVHATRCELEHRRRDRFQEPAVVRDEDHGRVDRLELALEPFEVLDVEVVRRLVEEEQVGAAGERSRERRPRQLTAGERAERAVEVVVGEAEPSHGCSCAIAPGPAPGVLESSLRLRVAAQRRLVVGAFRHGGLQAAQLALDVQQVTGAGERVLAERDVELERRPLVVERDPCPLREGELAALQ